MTGDFSCGSTGGAPSYSWYNGMMYFPDLKCKRIQAWNKIKATLFFFFKLINWRVLHCNSINRLWTRDTILHQTSWPTLVQVMTCCLLEAKPLAEPMLTDYQLGLEEHNWLDNVCKMPFVQASMCSIHCAIFRWLGARLQYLQCISNGDVV